VESDISIWAKGDFSIWRLQRPFAGCVVMERPLMAVVSTGRRNTLIFCQDVDFTKLFLDQLDPLGAVRDLFRSRAVITTVQLSSLGTMAILIDGGQSSKVDSFSRKIQIKSVLEILFLANKKSLSKT
jgi:hypothetical protein